MKVSTNRVVMKAMIIQLVFSCLLFSCSNNSREKSVDSSELSNIDYRLFQNTPAWELAKAVQEEDMDNFDKIISERDVLFSDIKLIDCDCEGKSIVEFSVKRRVERDSDSDYSEQIVPFQIAYAVSIHKAQGLEYKSVKVVITEDIDEKISHNIFYTAITRTTDKLKIYMSKETQKKLAEKFVKSNVGLKQAQLFAGQAGLKLKNKLSS